MRAHPSHQPKRPIFASALGYLITINVAVFLLQSAGMLQEVRLYDERLEVMQFGSLARSDLTEHFEWWRLFTYMFVHAVPEPLHIGLNMLMVFVCGRVVQTFLGGRALVHLYILGGLLGGLAHVTAFPDPIIGASAAAYSLLVALGMLMPERKVFVLLGLILPVRVRVKYLVIGMVAVTVIFFFIDLIAGSDADIAMISNVGHLAHLGGALGGFLYCKAIGVGRSLTLADLQAQRRAADESVGTAALRPPPGGFNSGMIRAAESEADAFSMTELDPVFDKIASEGFLSLTDEEMELLKRGNRRMSRT